MCLNPVLRNDTMIQAYAAVDPKDKKRVAYVTSYSRLGLLWTHVFQCSKSKEAIELVDCINERRFLAAENVKKVKATGVEVRIGRPPVPLFRPLISPLTSPARECLSVCPDMPRLPPERAQNRGSPHWRAGGGHGSRCID